MNDQPIRFTAKLNGAFTVARFLRRHPEKIGRTLESLVKQEARGLAVELARNTKPFGFSQKALARGEGAVAKDITKVFALPSDAYEDMRKTEPATADTFWAHIANRRFARARKTLATSNSAWKNLSVGRLDPKLHKAARTPKGNVPKHFKPAQIVTSKAALDTYIARVQRRVGFAKGAWINAAKGIGGRVRGAVQWATRHKQAPGNAIVKTGDKPAVTLVNRLDYIDRVTTYRGIELALEVAAGKLRKALATSLDRINQQANRALRRRAG